MGDGETGMGFWRLLFEHHGLLQGIVESCLKKEAVLSPDRVTSVDYWVSYVAQYYDLNFKETWQIMKEEDYISRIIWRLDYKEKDTLEKMKILDQQMNDYMENILC